MSERGEMTRNSPDYHNVMSFVATLVAFPKNGPTHPLFFFHVEQVEQEA